MTDTRPDANQPPNIARPKAMEVEQHGIDTIPARDRHSSPLDLFRIQFGAANTFATVLLGTFPILLGLSWWQGVAATVLGLVVGSVILMPMGLFGPVTGTNNAVSSGAHFGVRGRIAGSFLSLLTAIAFFSISVWVSGDALVGGMVRLFGVEDSDWLRAVAYAVLGALALIIVIYGYAFMLLVNKVVVVANTILFLLAGFAYSSLFTTSYDPGPDAYALGAFWPTFILSALIVMGNPISFGAFLGDWTRYIPESASRGRLLGATFLGQMATLIPFLFGLATATIVAGEADYVVALIQASPLWYALVLMLVAFLGGLSTGTVALYGTGLDFSSVIPRLNRVQASLLIGGISFVFILVGRLVFDLIGSVNAFIGAIIICTTPWMVIMMIGFAVRRGFYRPRDLQVFNHGKTGGAYWFGAGLNWRGLGAWVPAAVLGLLFANYPPLIQGPFRDMAGGIDLSLPVSMVSAAVLYLAFLVVFPEPRDVFAPVGPLLVRASDTPPTPIQDDPSASAARIRRRDEAQARLDAAS